MTNRAGLKATILLAALAAPLPLSAQEEADPEPTGPTLETSGSFFSRYELRRGYAQAPVLGDEPASDLVRYRARLGLHVEALSADPVVVGAHFVPQAGGYWHIGGDDLADPALGLHEGYVDVGVGGARFDIGRFEMVYGDHLVIGNVDWHHTGRAFNGVRARLPVNVARVDLFFTTLNEGFEIGPYADPYGAGDVYFAGAYAGLGKLLWEDLDLDVYALSRIWPGVQDLPADPDLDGLERDPAADVTPGVRVKGKAGVVDFRAEQGLQVGTRPGVVSADASSVLAYQGDVEIGLDLRESAHVRLAAEAFYASGDNPDTERVEAYDHLYPTAHKWIGLMDFVGPRSNVYGGVFHGQAAFSPVAMNVDVHAFWRPYPAAGADPYLGTEIDSGLVWSVAKPLKLRAVYGIFAPAEGDPLHFAEFAARATF